MVSIRQVKRKGKKYINGQAYTLDLTAKESEEFGLFPVGKGKRTWRGTYRTKTEAKEAIKHLETESSGYSSKAQALTLSEVRDLWLERANLSKATMYLYETCWPHLESLQNKHIDGITRKEVKTLLEGLPFSKNRIKSVKALLNHCYNYAIDKELITATPMTNLRIKYSKPSESAEIKYWTMEQANKLLSTVPKPRFDLFYRLLLHTGCRRGELLALKWESVDFENSTISLWATYDRQFGYREPKTESSKRTISLRQQELNLLKAEHHDDLVYVFQRPDKVEPFSINSIQNEFYSLTDSLSLPHIGLHGLRHTHATLALQARTPVEVVSKRLGHSKIATTLETYRHVIPVEDINLAKTLGELLD